MGNGKTVKQDETGDEVLVCGIVMPISAIDGCSEQHWTDVKQILCDAVKTAGFEPNLVSSADDVGIIQKRIIQNLYENPVVICDVSGKNPNVMFELGMRLAFDKPTIIVKDEITSYSFDTAPIEHLTYPRDLRFNRILEFKESLKTKLTGTYKASRDNSSFTTFLKNFGTFTIPKLETAEVSKEDFLIQEMGELRNQVQMLVSQSRYSSPSDERSLRSDRDYLHIHGFPTDECKGMLREVVRTIIQGLREKGVPEKTLLSSRQVIEGINLSTLRPACFDEERPTCYGRVLDAIECIRAELMP